MPATASITIGPGTSFLEDNGIPGDNISRIRLADGSFIDFEIPTTSLTIASAGPGATLIINLTDPLGAASLTVGSLTDPTKSMDSILVRNVETTGLVTLVSNGAIGESGNDAAPDIVAGGLILSAQSGIGSTANALETQTARIEAETSNGGISMVNLGPVQIGGLTDDVDGLDVINFGDLTFTNYGTLALGDIDVDPANPANPTETVHGGLGSGNVTLTALGYDSDIFANTSLLTARAPHGSISLTAGRDIALGTAGMNFGNDLLADGDVTLHAGRDVAIDGFADLNSDAMGGSTGGDVVVGAGRNINILAANGNSAGIAALGAGGGNVTLTTGPGGTLNLVSPQPDGILSTSGNISINADRVVINENVSTIRAGGPGSSVTLTPVTAGRAITLGTTADPATALGLSGAEIGRITATNLIIGSLSSGKVSVVNPLAQFEVSGALELRSGTDIAILASINLHRALTLRAGDNIFFTPSTTNVTTFNAFADQVGDDDNLGGFVSIGGIVAADQSTLTGNGDADTLTGTSAAETLRGLGGNDVLRGAGGKDTLDGGTGADTMAGGLGDDTFMVDQSTDTVTEAAGEGSDTVITNVSYALAAGQEIELLQTFGSSTTAPINLNGNAIGQTILGNAAANSIDGKGGADVMRGFAGNDTYFVDVAGDAVVEAAGGGSDTIITNVSYSLAAGQEIELLQTFGSATSNVVNLSGNEFGQTILGNAAANSIDGKGGADIMRGFAGDDIYFVDLAGDAVIEAAGGGSDTVITNVSYTLGAGQEIETLQTFGSATTNAINLTGNALANTIVANAAVNVIDGKGGADILYGKGGADTFAFTTALGGGNVDTLKDFQHGVDKIALENAVFTGLGAGALPANAFVTGSAAADADDRIIYNATTGQLFFDADGNGAGAAILFATLQGAPSLSASDFTVI